MLKVGIIGAGNISIDHVKAYLQNSECEIVAICDRNAEQAQKMADKYGIPQTYTDYHDILNDASIDVVSIATPTFTHKQIALEAIKSQKHVLCEKPPALNADEVKEIREALKNSSKVFMFGLVCRFRSVVQQVKEMIASGKLGPIICADVARTARVVAFRGWLVQHSLGGGCLRDMAIHELDLALYLMGYPKPKEVKAFWSRANNDLPGKLQGVSTYPSADKAEYKNDTEDIIKGFITFENGVNLTVKAGNVFLSRKERYLEINGLKAGALLEFAPAGDVIKMIEVTDDFQLKETTTEPIKDNLFGAEINHFIACCQNKAECIVKVDEAVALMELIDAMYRSAESGETVLF